MLTIPKVKGRHEDSIEVLLTFQKVLKNEYDWDMDIDEVIFVYKATKHCSTGVPPLMMLYG